MSQYQQVLEHLEKGYSISQLEATQKYGILRLGAIIFNLRRDGYSISTEIVHKKNKNGHTTNYAVYQLEQKG